MDRGRVRGRERERREVWGRWVRVAWTGVDERLR